MRSPARTAFRVDSPGRPKGEARAEDRITRVQIEGLRVIDKIDLPLRGLTVLIGDNGSGKSTVLEALELLRSAAKPGSYVEVLGVEHGPFEELVRLGRDRLTLGVDVEGGGPKLHYELTATLAGTSCVISEERLDVHADPTAPKPLRALIRAPRRSEWYDQKEGKLVDFDGASVPPDALAAPIMARGIVRQEASVRLVRALEGIEVHPPFDVRPLWQQRELEVRVGPRWPSRPEAYDKLRRYGHALPAALVLLRNDLTLWNRMLARARAALGPDLADLRLVPAGAGQLDVELKLRSPSKPVSARLLSEGQLSYLLMLVVAELGESRTLLALDEPDIHYHPELVVNLVQILEDLAEDHPVVVATHSDRLLDALGDTAAASVVLCDLDEKGATRLRRPQPERLAEWLESYRGLGALRAEGYQPHVFDGGPEAGGEDDR